LTLRDWKQLPVMRGGYKETVISKEQTARARSSASKGEVMRMSNEDEERARAVATLPDTYWKTLTNIPHIEEAVFNTKAWGFLIYGNTYAEDGLSCQIQEGR
jgi:hypothetical protein